MSIWFYSKTPGYEFLSNFAHSPFELEGQRWDTVEHWYQASKYADEAASDLIRNAPSASLARQLGQDPRLPLRANWNSIKERVMYQGLRAKFGQHIDLKRRLLATEGRLLIHESELDGFWGRSRTGGVGENRLGELLMLLRAEYLAGSRTGEVEAPDR